MIIVSAILISLTAVWCLCFGLCKYNNNRCSSQFHTSKADLDELKALGSALLIIEIFWIIFLIVYHSLIWLLNFIGV